MKPSISTLSVCASWMMAGTKPSILLKSISIYFLIYISHVLNPQKIKKIKKLKKIKTIVALSVSFGKLKEIKKIKEIKTIVALSVSF